MIYRSHPALVTEGVSRSSTRRGAGGDGRVGPQDVRCNRVRSSRVVVVPRRWDQPPGRKPGATEANKPGLRREREVSRKAIAQGVPDRFGLPDYLVCASTLFSTQGLRVRPAPGAPCALFLQEGQRFDKARTQIAPRECCCMSSPLSSSGLPPSLKLRRPSELLARRSRGGAG